MRPLNLAILIAATVGLGACSSTHESLHDHAVPATAAVSTVPQVNVPGLLGLSIDEVSERVGPRLPVPADFVDPTIVPSLLRNEVIDSTALFKYQGLAMVAAYDHSTRKISDLLLLGRNERELMRRAQLQLGAAHYLVLPVFQQRQPTQLMGLRVLTTNRN